MTFLTPTLAAIAAAVAIPTLVILYFLKLRRRDMEVSTTLLWKKAIQDLQANAPFQRLRRNILLFLQLLVLAAALFALAQPIIKGQTLQGARHVIMIDRSASMQSIDVKDAQGRIVSRLDEAKRQALELVDSLREERQLFAADGGDQAMVIAFDSQAEALQAFTSDKGALRRAIEAITPTEKPSQLQRQRGGIVDAVRIALAQLPRRRMLDNAGGTIEAQSREIEGLFEGSVAMHVYSDGRLPDSREARTGVENTVEYHKVGDEAAVNIGVVGLRAQRDYENPQRVSIFANILSTDTSPRSVDAELMVNGLVVARRQVELTAASEPQVTTIDGQRGEESRQMQLRRPGAGGVEFQLEQPEGMLVTLRVLGVDSGSPPEGDTLRVDDRAWLVVPPARRISVALVNSRNFPLRFALEGLPLARLSEYSTAQWEQLWKEGKAGAYDVTILDGVIPDVGQGSLAAPSASASTTPASTPRRPLPPGNYLVFDAVPGGVGLEDRGTGGFASIIDWDRDHEVTRDLSLDNVQVFTFREVWVEPGSPIRKLATAEKGPAILEITTNDTRALVVPFDYAESNWWMELPWTVFVGKAVKYLGDELEARIDARTLTAGGELVDRLPLGASDARIRGPREGDSRDESIAVESDGAIRHRLPPLVGVYEVAWSGQRTQADTAQGTRPTRLFAANLLDAAESDTPAAPDLELANKTAQGQDDSSSQADRRLWPYLLLAGLAIVMLEWWVYNRKVHV